jgi:hypothetical protein
VPAGRLAGAARERGDEPRPREPLSLRFKDRLEKRPSMSEIRPECNLSGDHCQ